MTTRSIATVLTAAALALLPACGDDEPTDGTGAADADVSVSIGDESSDASTEPSDATTSADAEPEAAGDPAAVLQELFQAYYDGDADAACELQTERYTKLAIEDAIKDEYLENGATCADLVAVASELYQAYGFNPGESTYEVVSDDGSTATVALTSPGDDSSESYVLVNTDGQWLLDEELSGS